MLHTLSIFKLNTQPGAEVKVNGPGVEWGLKLQFKVQPQTLFGFLFFRFFFTNAVLNKVIAQPQQYGNAKMVSAGGRKCSALRTRNKQVNSKPCIYITWRTNFPIQRSKGNTVFLSLNVTFASAVKCVFHEEELRDGESKAISMLVALPKCILSEF